MCLYVCTVTRKDRNLFLFKMGIGTVSMKLMLFFLVEEGEQSIDKDTRLNKELDLTQACLMINPKVSRN